MQHVKRIYARRKDGFEPEKRHGIFPAESVVLEKAEYFMDITTVTGEIQLMRSANFQHAMDDCVDDAKLAAVDWEVTHVIRYRGCGMLSEAEACFHCHDTFERRHHFFCTLAPTTGTRCDVRLVTLVRCGKRQHTHKDTERSELFPGRSVAWAPTDGRVIACHQAREGPHCGARYLSFFEHNP